MMNPSLSSLKVILISTSLLSVAVALKLSVPAITDFAVSEVPSIYNGILSWLKPPYLYLVINCIIITIVASSKLQSQFDRPHHHAPLSPEAQHVPMHSQLVVQPPVSAAEVTQVLLRQPPHHLEATDSDAGVVLRDELVEAVGVSADVSTPLKAEEVTDFTYSNSYTELNRFETKSNLEVDNELVSSGTTSVLDDAPPPELEIKDEFVISKSTWSSPPPPRPPSTIFSRNDSMEFAYSTEKPPVSSRFGHRRAVKATPEGGKPALRVSKPKRHDTLESTWKTITEGRAMPLTRHLRKSDTWERETHGNGGRHNHVPPTPADQKMSKSETFNDRGGRSSEVNNVHKPSSLQRSSAGSGGGKLKKEPSLGQDELNRRVEAFIKKFNEEMRMQRQESLNQYMEMINRGAH